MACQCGNLSGYTPKVLISGIMNWPVADRFCAGLGSDIVDISANVFISPTKRVAF